MAWINVHEDVVGPKLRHLAKLSGLSQNEALGTLIVLWLWGIKNADQTGFIKSADRSDVSDVISSGLTAGVKPLKVVENMIESGWIDECGGELYLHDWDEWQEMWYKYLGRREKDTARKRMARDKDRESAFVDRPELVQDPIKPKTPPAPSASKKAKKEKPEKKEFAEFVSMQQTEYDRLVQEYGKSATEKMVEILDNYKGSSGKKYTSDYRAILNWVVGRVKEQHPGLIRVSGAMVADSHENPFAEWGDDIG